MSDEPKPRFRIRVVLVGTAIGLVGLCGLGLFFDFLDPLLFGGVRSLVRSLRNFDVANPMLIGFLLGVVALGIGLHLFAQWLSRESQRQRNEAEPAPWKAGWSVLIVALVLTFFVAGICALGIVHQTTWLATDPEGIWFVRRGSTFESVGQPAPSPPP